jgi:C-type mannose receptor
MYVSGLCGLGWVYSVENNFCYQIDVGQPKTWQAARKYCQQNGGDLLSISDITEQNFVEGQYMYIKLYIWSWLQGLKSKTRLTYTSLWNLISLSLAIIPNCLMNS